MSDNHTKYLERLCRICGMILTGRVVYKVEKFIARLETSMPPNLILIYKTFIHRTFVIPVMSPLQMLKQEMLFMGKK